MEGSGFESTDTMQIAKFAEGESFVLMQKLARDRVKAKSSPKGSSPAEEAVVARREALETLITLSGPMMPHLAEEMWKTLGHDGLLADTSWPTADASLIVEDSISPSGHTRLLMASTNYKQWIAIIIVIKNNQDIIIHG